jgi:hypothetical protein
VKQHLSIFCEHGREGSEQRGGVRKGSFFSRSWKLHQLYPLEQRGFAPVRFSVVLPRAAAVSRTDRGADWTRATHAESLQYRRAASSAASRAVEAHCSRDAVSRAASRAAGCTVPACPSLYTKARPKSGPPRLRECYYRNVLRLHIACTVTM